MHFSDNGHPLRVQFDAHHFKLEEAELERMRNNLDSLIRQVENFPKADLHVLIEYNNRNNDYSVKTSLILTGATLVASDHSATIHPAWENCLHNLTRELVEYKGRLGQEEERHKTQQGTHQRLEPDTDPDMAKLEKAVEEGDYAAFREATLGFEEPLRRRVGRWLERYPDLNARIGHGLTVADIVEDVFLTAFEGWPTHPVEVRMGDWLESLIDPTIHAIQQHPDEELENVSMARTLRGVEPHPEEM